MNKLQKLVWLRQAITQSLRSLPQGLKEQEQLALDLGSSVQISNTPICRKHKFVSEVMFRYNNNAYITRIKEDQKSKKENNSDMMLDGLPIKMNNDEKVHKSYKIESDKTKDIVWLDPPVKKQKKYKKSPILVNFVIPVDYNLDEMEMPKDLVCVQRLEQPISEEMIKQRISLMKSGLKMLTNQPIKKTVLANQIYSKFQSVLSRYFHQKVVKEKPKSHFQQNLKASNKYVSDVVPYITIVDTQTDTDIYDIEDDFVIQF